MELRDFVVKIATHAFSGYVFVWISTIFFIKKSLNIGELSQGMKFNNVMTILGNRVNMLLGGFLD